MIAAFLIATSAAGASPVAPPSSAGQEFSKALRSSAAPACDKPQAGEILVCGSPGDKYRIEPFVLEATRAREAMPPAPDTSAAEMPAEAGCVGPQACKGDVVPLVGMALVAAKAAALAMQGEDWRQALRTREDEYRLKKQAEERRARERRPRIGFGAVR